MIQYQCGKCGAQMESPEAMKDKVEVCPSCGTLNRVSSAGRFGGPAAPARWRRRVLIGGLLLVFLTGLFPPATFVLTRTGDNYYVANGRTFLPYPAALAPQRSPYGASYRGHHYRGGYNRIDYWRLVLEWITMGSLAAVVILLLNPRQARRGTADRAERPGRTETGALGSALKI